MVKICSLASGSNGNAYYIETEEEAILIDVGISYRQLKNRAKSKGINIKKIKAVFITHEHSDHVRGLRVFSQNSTFETYMTQGTAHNCKSYYMPIKVSHRVKDGDMTEVGKFKVYCFSKPHDVAEPCSFRIEAEGINIGVFTDIGCVCEGLKSNLSKCHAVFLESNYDEDMLWTGKYPECLKRRVASDKGHLSNKQSSEIVAEVNPSVLHTIILSHLSADNNRPQIALKAFEQFKDRYTIMTASRYEAGELYTVTEEYCTSKAKPIVIPDRLDRCPIKI